LTTCHLFKTVTLFQFIDRDPSTRLGCRPNGQGIEDIQHHPWFNGIDWDHLESKESQPPFVPDVRLSCIPKELMTLKCSNFLLFPFSQMKQANFDVSHELDEFLMVEKPLTHSKRKANPDLEKMKPELRQLEEQ